MWISLRSFGQRVKNDFKEYQTEQLALSQLKAVMSNANDWCKVYELLKYFRKQFEERPVGYVGDEIFYRMCIVCYVSGWPTSEVLNLVKLVIDGQMRLADYYRKTGRDWLFFFIENIKDFAKMPTY